jgi:hypothetical protein
MRARYGAVFANGSAINSDPLRITKRTDLSVQGCAASDFGLRFILRKPHRTGLSR